MCLRFTGDDQCEQCKCSVLYASMNCIVILTMPAKFQATVSSSTEDEGYNYAGHH